MSAAAPADALDRFLSRSLARVGAEPEDRLDDRFAALRRFLVLVVAVESWNALRYRAYQDDLAIHTAIAGIQLVCLGAAWAGPGTRVATAVSAAGLAVGMGLTFPFNANHQAVQLLCLVALSLPGAGVPESRRDVLLAVRWFAVAILFWAGVQKLLWGLYIGGEFLAHRIAIDPGFAQVFGWVVSDAEIARLTGLEAADGAGPFRIDAWWFVAISNLSWIAEVAIAGALLHPHLRPWAWPAGLAFIFAVELAAREVLFGSLLAFLILLFQEGRWAPRSLWVFVPGAVYVFAMALDWLPHWGFG